MKKAESAPAKMGPLALMNTAWETAKSLFDYRNANERLGQRLPEADLRAAVAVFVAAMLVGAALSFVIYAETLYFAAFTYKVLSEAIGGPAPEPDFSTLGPFAIFLLLTAPLTLLVGFFQDGIAYYALRLTGGRGTFTQQYYLSSFVTLATAMSSSIMVFGPVPCLGTPAVIAYLVVAIYLMFVVRCRAYATIHDISYMHALTIVFLCCIPAVVALLYANGAVAGALQIPQAQLYNLTNMTNITGA